MKPCENVAPIYLDNHATTPCDPRVVAAMLPTFSESFGNAASRQHGFGRAASALVEAGRERVARLIGATSREIVFTSGATESNNLAIKGVACASATAGRHIVTTRIEHRSVLDTCATLERQGFRVTYVGVSADGVLDVDEIADAIVDDTVLVSVMYANNEIGTVQPIGEIGAVAKKRGVIFHCDAVQALPHLACDVQALGIDLLSMSAHKMYGPKGVGALYVRRRQPHVRLSPQIDGGGHERGVRSGTSNVAGIVGLGVACELVAAEREADGARLRALRDRLHTRIADAVPDVRVNGSMERRLPNNLNLSFTGLRSDAILHQLEDVAVSSGSACSSASTDESYVLQSLGGERHQHASLRFGLGRFTTEKEVDRASAHVVEAVARARRAGTGSLSDVCDGGGH